MTSSGGATATYLLPGRTPTGLRGDFTAPPPRPGCRFEPIVDGVAAISAMERAIVTAMASVHLTMWIFNPDTPVVDGAIRRRGARTWGALLAAAASRGVQVRVLLTDFDPLLAGDLHANNWRAYSLLNALGRSLQRGSSGSLEVVVSLHPATASVFMEATLGGALAAEVKRLNRRAGPDVARLRFRPGLWPLLSYSATSATLTRRAGVSLMASPVAHHQKLLVVDQTVGFCGGLDVNRGRIDSPTHDATHTTWHDVQVRLEGPVVADLTRNFVLRWNAESPGFDTFRSTANAAGMPVTLPVSPVTPLALPTAPAQVLPPPGTSAVQALRTVSRQSALSPVPTTVVADIAAATERMVGAATSFIYLENQYVRSRDLEGWILARARTIKELVVIVALPVAPEEVSLPGGADRVTLHGLSEQHTLLTNLAVELGPRFGVFSMVQRSAAPRAKAIPSGGAATTDAFGSRQIYLHTKALIVDDTSCMVGSANANPRSLKIDTELSVATADPAVTSGLRLMLWKELLGNPAGLAAWKPADFLSRWTAIAAANEKVRPAARSGFVVRHDVAAFPGVAQGFHVTPFC